MKQTLLACALATLLFSGCHGSSTTTAAATPAPDAQATVSNAALLPPLADKYGFVRMDALMRSHPLAGQLAAMNNQLMTLHAQLDAPQSAQDLATIRATQVTLNRQLQTAAAHAQSLLHDQGVALAAQERAQVTALLVKQGNQQNQAIVPGRASGKQSAAVNLGAAVAAQSQAYASRLESERQHAIETLASSFNERDTRVFKTKQEALALQESDNAVKLAQADSAERVNLQTKAAEQGLSAVQKHAIADGLSSLDAKEEAQRKAEHAANLQILSRLHEQLQSDSQKEFNTQVAEIRGATEAQLRARGDIAQVQAAASLPQVSTPAPVAQNPALTAQIKEIHSGFQERFNADTRASVASFKATRAELQARFNQVARAHVDAQTALAKQIQTLERQRDDLITKMTAQIQTKTVSVAEHASIDVVLTQVLAQSHAIDLTDDVAHELTRTK